MTASKTNDVQNDKAVERLEEAMMRIASAAERQRRTFEASEAARHAGPDLSEVAANIDVLCARIQGLLDKKEA